eukprot:9850389-Lingulodinium_polyedra.AAC.1
MKFTLSTGTGTGPAARLSLRCWSCSKKAPAWSSTSTHWKLYGSWSVVVIASTHGPGAAAATQYSSASSPRSTPMNRPSSQP